jgi:hypothetical protein
MESSRKGTQPVAVGGTSHYNVSSSVHLQGSPCSGCLHPVDDDAGGGHIPTVSFVSFWAGLVMTVRLLRDALRQPYPPERQHLWLAPLRMDLPDAAMWMPVSPRQDLPGALLSIKIPNLTKIPSQKGLRCSVIRFCRICVLQRIHPIASLRQIVRRIRSRHYYPAEYSD